MGDERVTNRPSEAPPQQRPSGFRPPTRRPAHWTAAEVVKVMGSVGLFALLALGIDAGCSAWMWGEEQAFPFVSAPLGALAGAALGWWFVLAQRPRGTRVDERELPGPDDRPAPRPSHPGLPPLPPVGIVAFPRAASPIPAVPRPDGIIAHSWGVAGVAIAPDLCTVVSCGSSGPVVCHDLTTGLRVWWFDGMSAGRAVALSPDGQLVAACGSDEGANAVVHVLNARTGGALRRLDLTDTTASLAWLPDNRHLLIGCAAEIHVWHVDEAVEATRFSLPSVMGIWDVARCLAVDSRGRVLVAGMGESFEACVFALPDGETVSFHGHKAADSWLMDSGVRAVDITPDGRFVVTGCNAGTARVWSVLTREEICRFEGHAGWWGYRWITGVAWMPDGKRALSACVDGTLSLWDARSGQELQRWDHGKGIRCLALSADGKLAVTGAWEGSLRFWHLG